MEKKRISFDEELLKEIQGYSLEKNMKLLHKIEQISLSVLEKKDADYGGSWQKDGVLGAHLNMKRKFDRLHNIFMNGFDTKLDEETVMDTLLDLRNYISLYIVFMCNKNPEYLKALEDL